MYQKAERVFLFLPDVGQVHSDMSLCSHHGRGSLFGDKESQICGVVQFLYSLMRGAPGLDPGPSTDQTLDISIICMLAMDVGRTGFSTGPQCEDLEDHAPHPCA